MGGGGEVSQGDCWKKEEVEDSELGFHPVLSGGQYWIRTSDLTNVNRAL